MDAKTAKYTAPDLGLCAAKREPARLAQLWILVLLSVSACLPRAQYASVSSCSSDGSSSQSLYDGSRRADPPADPSDRGAYQAHLIGDEAHKFVKLGGKGCAAFAVRHTSKGRFVFASAYHCVSPPGPEGWCKTLQAGVEDIEDHNQIGRCSEVLFQDVTWDLFLFEVKPAGDSAEKRLENEGHLSKLIRLRFPSFMPRLDEPLIALGFPADSFRQGKATVTVKCEVTSRNEESRRTVTERIYRRGGRVPTATELKEISEEPTSLRFGHNCSIYGGNSGGPMLYELSDIFVGLPTTYVPQKQQNGLYKSDDPATWAKGEDAALFVDLVVDRKKELQELGIVMAKDLSNRTARDLDAPSAPAQSRIPSLAVHASERPSPTQSTAAGSCR